MKIIAHTKFSAHHGPLRVLIEADAKEVAHLFGFPDVSNHSAYLSSEKLSIGTEIKVDAAFQYVGWIYRHRDRFERIAKELRDAAASVDKFPELYADLSIPEKP